MRPYKSIFIGVIFFIVILIGCQKRSLPKISQPKKQIKTDLEALENQEMDYLLKAIKQTNPFRPDHAVGSIAIDRSADNTLKGIFWDRQKPFAIIGDSVVIEGDTIDNKKVTRIDKDTVTLDNQGKEEILKLEELPK